MFQHHIDSIEILKNYFASQEGVVAVVLDGSVVKGQERADSDIDAVVIVTEEKYAELKGADRLAEVITGYCTYEGGYFDIKYKTKAILRQSALHASEPTRNSYVKARTIYTIDDEIPSLVEKIAAYPEEESADKIRCFTANLRLNADYFLHCTGDDNAYMRAHLADEIVYSVYRLILIENKVLFPCNRRLQETVEKCAIRPLNIVKLGSEFLRGVTEEKYDAFVDAFLSQTKLPIEKELNPNLSEYVKFYEEWWMRERAPFPNEW